MINDLLVAISTFGVVNFEKFRNILDTILINLYGDNEELKKNTNIFDVLYNLELLGYCEIDYNKRLIYTYPPTLIQIPSSGLPKTLLIGGRSNKLIHKLQRIGEKNSEKIDVYSKNIPGKANEYFPESIFIETINKKYFNAVSEKTKINYVPNNPLSIILLEQSIDLNSYKDNLVSSDINEPNWLKKTFSPVNLFFSNDQDTDCLDIKLINYTNPVTNQQHTWLWLRGKAYKLNRNWGRFIVLNYYRRNVLLYDNFKQRLALPQTIKLPKPFARAAALCSGFAPRNTQLYEDIGSIKLGTVVTVFEEVSPLIAESISNKLGQKLSYGKI